MAVFVHLTPLAAVSRIRRNGIARIRKASDRHPRGVFAVPVTRSFYVSHQWLRELKRRGQGPIAGVYFRIPDREPVWVGHYRQGHRQMRASAAVAEFNAAEDRQGWEVIVPRRVLAREIRRIRSLPQVVGWRYHPEAKGQKLCACPYCSRGDYGARRLRARLGRSDA